MPHLSNVVLKKYDLLPTYTHDDHIATKTSVTVCLRDYGFNRFDRLC